VEAEAEAETEAEEEDFCVLVRKLTEHGKVSTYGL
jgi:hypothetical protein